METLPLICRAPHPPTTSLKAGVCNFLPLKSTNRRRSFGFGERDTVPVKTVRAFPERTGEAVDGGGAEREGSRGGRGGFTGSAMEVTTFNQSFGDAEFPVWDKIGAVVRLCYGIGLFQSILS